MNLSTESQCFHVKETSPLICLVDYLTGFYMMEILVSNLLTQSLISIPPETSENQRFSDVFRATGMKHWAKTG